VAGVKRTAARHARGSVLAFAGLAAIVVWPGHASIGLLDQAVIRLAENGRNPATVRTARVVSSLGEPGFVLIPIAGATAIALRRVGWRQACVPGITVATGAAVRRLLSRAIARDRPPEAIWLAEPEGFSMPSKHTSLAVLTAGACARWTTTSALGRQGVPLLVAACVGSSRIYLGVHWPSDVLAAWLFAEGWLQMAEAVSAASKVPAKPGRV
jgi:membrane-associated phospholipid phosphatase